LILRGFISKARKELIALMFLDGTGKDEKRQRPKNIESGSETQGESKKVKGKS